MFAPSVEKFGKNSIIYADNITIAYSIKVQTQLDRKILNIFECATCLIMSESTKSTEKNLRLLKM